MYQKLPRKKNHDISKFMKVKCAYCYHWRTPVMAKRKCDNHRTAHKLERHYSIENDRLAQPNRIQKKRQFTSSTCAKKIAALQKWGRALESGLQPFCVAFVRSFSACEAYGLTKHSKNMLHGLWLAPAHPETLMNEKGCSPTTLIHPSMQSCFTTWQLRTFGPLFGLSLRVDLVA